MNRVRRVAKQWLEARPYATAIKQQRQVKRNAERKPKPAKNPIKL